MPNPTSTKKTKTAHGTMTPTLSEGPQEVNSHRRIVHIVAICDCAGTGFILMALLCTFLISLLKIWDHDKKRKSKEDLDLFTQALIATKAITILAVSLNVCISIQLMHHTKPDNEKLDVLKRAESWRNYNLFLMVLMLFQIGFLFVSSDFDSGSLTLIFFISRIVFCLIVQRYIKELHMEFLSLAPTEDQDSGS